eukprot:PhF_6_TR12954/c1_g1_i3/m.20450/K10088/OS9; protein OS-9
MKGSSIVLVTLILLGTLVVCSYSSSPSPGGSDATDPKYSVEFVDSIDAVPVQSMSTETTSIVKMKAGQDGANYICYVPKPTAGSADTKQEESGSSSKSASSNNNKQLSAAALQKLDKAIAYYLTNVKGCVKRTVGWWTYELCWRSTLRQYHLNEQSNKIEADHDLGTHPAGGQLSYVPVDNTLAVPPHLKYEAVGGSVCDLTQLPRATEVRAYCNVYGTMTNQVDGFVEVQETQTCKYVAHVYLSVLCTHEGFAVKPVKKETIYCVKAEK